MLCVLLILKELSFFLFPVLGNFWQHLTNLGLFKCDQCAKHLFVKLCMEFQCKIYRMDFDIEDNMIINTS